MASLRMTSVCQAFVCVLLLSLIADAAPPVSPDGQVEFLTPTPLLHSDGTLAAWGWARRAVVEYNREAIPADRRGRIKEWEHYTVMSPEFTFGVTIAHLGALAFGSVELIDYPAKTQQSNMFIQMKSKDQSVFPPNPYGATELRRDDDFVSLRFKDKRRHLAFQLSPRGDSPGFVGQIELTDDPADDSIAIIRPFAQPGHFFYENKIVGMPGTGQFKIGEKEYILPEGKANAIFDWGRGIWPRQSQWFWGQASGIVDGKRVAINLGDGYGDDKKGTANAVFVDGKLLKLGNVACQFDSADRMKPWKFESDDGRLVLDFQPTYHQEVHQNIGIASAELHKIHGTYSGTIELEGNRISIVRLLGFAEHMKQRW